MSPWLLEDPEKVDEYRRSVDLGPLEEKIKQFRSEGVDETRPADLKEYREYWLAWAKSVGWL